MRIIVIGYGRVGSQAVRRFSAEDHQITVIDKDRAVLERAARDIHARIVFGDATDPELLREAGAEKADVVFALTRDENTNLMAAQIAKMIFKVPRVVAVVYDLQREQSFHAAEIETLALTLAGAEFLALALEGVLPRTEAAFEEVRRTLEGGMAEVQPVPVRAETGQQPFYVIIVGGGKVGYYLGRMLLTRGHEVTIIEQNPDIYALVSNQLDCPTIRGDGSTVEILERAGANRCNVFVAVTNHDHDNLIACQVAKFHFGIAKTIARVKNPKNEYVMRKLGVDVTVSSTALISEIIESVLPATRIRTLLNIRTANLEILEFALGSDAPVIGKQLKDVTFPPNSSIVTVLREGQALVPRGETAFQQQDTVLALVDRNSEAALRKVLLGGER
jgi:trk system potassium uptake protein TrkA